MTEQTKVQTVVSTAKELKEWILGVIGFGTAVTTFLTQAFHTPLDLTLISVTLVSIFFLAIVYLVYRTEQRMAGQLLEHKLASDEIVSGFNKRLDLMNRQQLESQRSTIRIEMDNEIHRNPGNHDTIIKYAHRYFKELDGDWVQTEKFLAWVESERTAGRPVHLPHDLLLNINTKMEEEQERLPL